MRRGSHRRRGAKSSWNWAVGSTLVLSDSGSAAGQQVTSPNLLPAPRVDWMLENGRGRDHLTVTGILLWLQFSVINTSTAFQQIQSEVQFAVQKLKVDYSSGSYEPQVASPYTQPGVPSGVTSWTAFTQDEQDGLDPFLWTHAIFPPQFPNSQYSTIVLGESVGSSGAYNIAGAGGTSPQVTQLVYPSGRVTAAWQPDVHIRTRRRLVKGEGLGLYMQLPAAGLGNQVVYSLTYRARVLTT